MDTREVLYLSRAEVASLLPPIERQLDIVEETYLAMADGRVELPPKPGIHPRPDAFIHAMPAYLADADVAAVKWVAGYPGNQALGLPYIHGLIILNDPATGVPLAIMDGSEITASRTAAASGVCVRRWAPRGWPRAAILGCGVQGRIHAEVLRSLNPAVELAVWDPDRSRAEALEGPVDVTPDARAAVEGADVVITAGPIVKSPEPTVDTSWLGDRWLVLPVDFDASVRTGVVGAADLFAVDDVGQFDHYRASGHFPDWSPPRDSVGALLRESSTPRHVVCCNLGVGSLDAALAAHVLAAADRLPELTRLPL